MPWPLGGPAERHLPQDQETPGSNPASPGQVIPVTWGRYYAMASGWPSSKASASRPGDTRFEPCFSWSSCTSDLGPVSCHRRRRQSSDESSQYNRHSIIGTQQSEYHEALPSSVNDEVRCDCTFANNGNASRNSVC